jgi:preprotein translocase subunit Sec61beta
VSDADSTADASGADSTADASGADSTADASGAVDGERLRRAARAPVSMSSNDGSGLMSSAGLVRYFDAEDSNAIRIDPRTVIAFGAFFGFLIMVLRAVGL